MTAIDDLLIGFVCGALTALGYEHFVIPWLAALWARRLRLRRVR